MAKKSGTANLVWFGGGCIVFAFFNLLKLVLTGTGFSSRFGHDMQGGWALLGSVAFFILGTLCLGIWVLLKAFGGNGRQP